MSAGDPFGIRGRCVRSAALPDGVRAERKVLGCNQQSLMLAPRWRGDAEVQRGEPDRDDTGSESVFPTPDDRRELRGGAFVVARAGPAHGCQSFGTGRRGNQSMTYLRAVGAERLRELRGQLLRVRYLVPAGRAIPVRRAP
ncbi:hypothetical protein GCM10010326_76810 [Streptomyces xanthochromogenes]|uniref:Uncharacterized protein n=1 Tax=Streptomyces xanthochromogenes TaxID=67384 RepID=A0ABQ3AXX9_9ACTN|nr:hypothetical protein GCM10010326_76810 [Streptomyces xanthochromogenes]